MGKKVYRPINRHINASRTHYLKWDITEDISVRYHFLHQGNRELEGQFIIKIHSDGSYQLVDREFAHKFILNYKEELNPPNTDDFLTTPDYEITGRLMRCPLTDRIEFHKTIIDKHMVTHFGIDKDNCLKTISYNQDGELYFKENLIIEKQEGYTEAHQKMKDEVEVEMLKVAHGLYVGSEGIKSNLEEDYHSPIQKDIANNNLKVVIDNGFGTKDERELKIKVVHQDDLVSLDENTTEAVRFASDAANAYLSLKTEGAIMSKEDPNDIKPRCDRNGLPISN